MMISDLNKRIGQLHADIWREQDQSAIRRMRAKIEELNRRVRELAYLKRVDNAQREQTLNYIAINYIATGDRSGAAVRS